MKNIWIDQCFDGVRLRNVKGEDYNKLYNYLKLNFESFEWSAFNYWFFIPDHNKGRHENMAILRQILNQEGLHSERC